MRTTCAEGTSIACGQQSQPTRTTWIAPRELIAVSEILSQRTASAIHPLPSPFAARLRLPSVRFSRPSTCPAARLLGLQFEGPARLLRSRDCRTVAASASSLAWRDLACWCFPCL